MTGPGSAAWRADQADALLAFGRGSELPDGGFGWLTERGTVDTDRPRPLYLTARATYVWTLAHLRTGEPEYRRLAVAGLTTLATRYADRTHGGFVAALTPDGRVGDATKANYAHAHVLLAAASASLLDEPLATDLLAAVTATIDEHFWSATEQAAVEDYDPAFDAAERYRGANSNMHSVEAYLAAGDVTGDGRWHERALAIARRLIDGEARAHGWRLPEHYDTDWRALLDYNADRPDDPFRPFGWTPGHSFEWARLLIALEASLADPPPWLPEAAAGLFEQAVTGGWAPDGHPGFVYTLDFADRPVVSERLHWVACEAVLAADALRRRTGQSRYAEQRDAWWAHIVHFLDAVNGGWWQELSPQLQPSATVWSGKPDLYHSYQALVLPSLPLAPCAALALSREGAGPAADDSR